MMEYTIFGGSHGPAVGVLIQNIPAGLPVDGELIHADLLRRKASGALATGRHEPDEVELLSGVYQGRTTGDALVAVLRNRDVRSGDYAALRDTPRPGHADYAAFVRSGGCNDYRGGGRFSGRLTAPLTVAGSLALRRRAAEARENGDSVGGQIRCTVSGVPAGLGGPDWRDTVESEISRHVFAIPAVKAIGFGEGEGFAALHGSEANDAFRTDGSRVFTETNHAGGINGGISNGMDIVFTATFRPTPSIAKPQETVDLARMENTAVTVGGRHDSCVALRAAPVVEAAAALAICRLLPADDGSLAGLRRQLDDVDEQMTALLARRLALAGEIGRYKAAQGLPVLDEAREKEVLARRGDLLPQRRQQVERLFRLLMALRDSALKDEEAVQAFFQRVIQSLTLEGGDLILLVSVRPHPIFERQGNNLYCEMPITFAEATLGAKVTVPTLEGSAEFTIPEGTQNGSVFSLKGKGVTSVNGKTRGDLRVKVNIEVPKNLTKKQKDLLGAFAESCGTKNHKEKQSFFDKFKKQ